MPTSQSNDGSASAKVFSSWCVKLTAPTNSTLSPQRSSLCHQQVTVDSSYSPAPGQRAVKLIYTQVKVQGHHRYTQLATVGPAWATEQNKD